MQAHGHDHPALSPSQQHPIEVRAGPRRALVEGALRPVQVDGGDLPPPETGDRKRGRPCGCRDGQAPLPLPVDTDVARRDHKPALLEQKAVPWDAEELRITEPARHPTRQRCRQEHGAGHGKAEEVGGLSACRRSPFEVGTRRTQPESSQPTGVDAALATAAAWLSSAREDRRRPAPDWARPVTISAVAVSTPTSFEPPVGPSFTSS
jgi:hypothetical protein